MSAQTDLLPLTASTNRERDAEGWQKTPPEDRSIDFWNLLCQKLFGVSTEWRWFKLEVINETQDMVVGAVPVGYRKDGRPIWKGKGERYVVYRSAMQSFLLGWERETGKCHECYGEGECVRGSSRERGFLIRTCTRCGGNGKAVAV